MAYPLNITRLANFSRNQANGQDLDVPALDSELNQILLELAQLNTFVRGITTAAGLLQFTTALREMDLLEQLTFVATSGQTAFTVATYDTATDKVNVFVNGVLLRPSLVVLTNATTVTIPARTTGDIVVIEVHSAGSGALTKLASTAINLGASLVGIYDAGGIVTATTVEAAIQEIMTKLNTLITDLGTLALICHTTGFTMSAPIAMGGSKITGLAAGTANGDAIRWEQFTAYTNIWDNLSANFLPKGGGTLTGPLAMSAQKITGMADPTAAQDAATKAYVDAQISANQAPIGQVMMWPASAMPSAQWLACDGTAVSRTAYATLNARLAADGYAYGVGDGATTFNLPDFRSRSPVGAGTGSGLTTRALGGSGGEELHTMTEAEMFAHTHGVGWKAAANSGVTVEAVDNYPGAGGSYTSQSKGSSTPFNVMHPWRGIYFIIKVL